MSTDLPLIDILLPKYPIDVMMWAKFRSIELLAEVQRVVQREQGHRAPGKRSSGAHGRFARHPAGVAARWGRQAQRTGNRNGGRRVDYENVYAAGTTPFSNECSGGVYVVATGFSGIPRLILPRKRFFCPGCIVSRAAFPVPCCLFPVPFALPFAFLTTAQ